jgi:hypothetical protein
LFLESIETQFTMGSYHYTQLERHGTLAIYEQRHKDNPKVVRYEVIRIRVQREHTWPNGVSTPEKEAYPGAYAWGSDGHTCFTLPEAQALLVALARRLDDSRHP